MIQSLCHVRESVHIRENNDSLTVNQELLNEGKMYKERYDIMVLTLYQLFSVVYYLILLTRCVESLEFRISSLSSLPLPVSSEPSCWRPCKLGEREKVEKEEETGEEGEEGLRRDSAGSEEEWEEEEGWEEELGEDRKGDEDR